MGFLLFWYMLLYNLFPTLWLLKVIPAIPLPLRNLGFGAKRFSYNKGNVVPTQFCCRSGIKCILGPGSPYTGKVMSVAR